MKSSDRALRAVRLKPGDRVTARWNRIVLEVERRLGEGANGCVYLVRDPQHGCCAMKAGYDAFALQSEINALRAVGGEGPELLFADDGICAGMEFPMYVMSFVRGSPLSSISLAGRYDAFFAVGAGLLDRLSRLHAAGWAFGDLKPDNILVGPGYATQLVDYGGATPFGHSVRQFTEMYDRGTWRLGGRRADAAYDLFSFAVVMLEAAGFGGRLRTLAATAGPNKGERLIALTNESGLPPAAADELKRLLRGHYRDSISARDAWIRASAEPNRVPHQGADKRWPQYWLAGALAAFAAAILWMNGTN